MIRLSKLTDYSFVVLTRFAASPADAVHNARDVSVDTSLPLPTVSKLLKILSRHGLLIASRGVKGGYRLSRTPEQISAAEIIDALEGPLAMTDCLSDEETDCMLDGACPCQSHWHLINQAVQKALEGITLAHMTRPAHRAHFPAMPAAALPVLNTTHGQCACTSHGTAASGLPCACDKDAGPREMDLEESDHGHSN